MSKRAYISRYLLILKRLKAKPYSDFEDLQYYIDRELEYLQERDETLNMGLSKRTFQRDLKEIRILFGIDIEYSKANKGYFINHTDAEYMNFQRMIEAFEMFNSLNIAQDLKPFIHLEKRRPQGTENLYGLLHAIKNSLGISFTYFKFWDENASQRTVVPYAMKEFKNRWYLLAKDKKDGVIKSFALDRLTCLEISNNKFDLPQHYSTDEYYRYCFGIISPNDKEPHDIVLSFDPFQGKYIKTLPLHESQEVLIDTEEELRIKVKLYITHDLMMELLSFGDNVRVLKPELLAEEVKNAHRKAYLRY